MKVTNTVNMNAVDKKIRFMLNAYSQTQALKLEMYAKAKAPWTDRTTNARNSIQGKAKWEGNTNVIILSGNMNYSRWLELAHEKRYAILVPTIEKHASEILSGYKNLIDGL